MAKYRLQIAHELETRDGQRLWLPGDKENEGQGDERGTLVGDGTNYMVRWPTLYMTPLDAEAEAMVAREAKRLADNESIRDPIEMLPLNDYEERYIPGMDGKQRRPPPPDGASVAEIKAFEAAQKAAATPQAQTKPQAPRTRAELPT